MLVSKPKRVAQRDRLCGRQANILEVVSSELHGVLDQLNAGVKKACFYGVQAPRSQVLFKLRHGERARLPAGRQRRRVFVCLSVRVRASAASVVFVCRVKRTDVVIDNFGK